MNNKILIMLLIASLLLGGCSTGSDSSALSASGTIAADSIRIAPEIGGKVVAVLVREGDEVAAGDALFQLDDEILQAQYAQAEAAATAAEKTVQAARDQLVGAQIQLELTIQQVRMQDLSNRMTAWTQAAAEGSDLPIWYYQKGEQIEAVQAEVDAADLALATALANLETELNNASNEDFIAVEKELAAAQASFEIAEQTSEQARTATDNKVLVDAAQENLDTAEADLDAAQLAYDRMLSSSAADAILEARAKASLAQARLDNAQDKLISLQTGEEALQVEGAQIQVTQAQTALAQAEANLAQAQAALNLLDLQLKRTTVSAPTDGTILSMDLEVGELIASGGVVMTIGKLEEVTLTVYVPEDQYGKIELGQKVSVAVDSYPGRAFTGEVQQISDEAEYTPRNVQTVESRKSTVYGIKIFLSNADQALKPGMPADVDFGITE